MDAGYRQPKEPTKQSPLFLSFKMKNMIRSEQNESLRIEKNVIWSALEELLNFKYLFSLFSFLNFKFECFSNETVNPTLKFTHNRDLVSSQFGIRKNCTFELFMFNTLRVNTTQDQKDKKKKTAR